MPVLLHSGELAGIDEGQLGGKAAGLRKLERIGAPVPAWAVIPWETVAARPWATDPNAGEVLREAFRTLTRPPFRGLAVRSSATVEDTASQSGAGLFETRFVFDEAELVDAVNAVADSLGTRAGAGMAVILQARVEAGMAGVLFSANPASADPAEAYLEAVLGSGGRLVDGEADPSRFRLSLELGRVLSVLPGKEGPPELDQSLLNSLLHWLERAEGALDAAVDVEWAAVDGELWILQARPVTALHLDAALRPGECVTSWFFDQRFAEPIYPLSQTSLLPLIARIALHEALEMRGDPEPGACLTFYAGQAYVPHQVYRRLFAGAPRKLLSQDLGQLFPAQCYCPAMSSARGATLGLLFDAVRSIAARPCETLGVSASWSRFTRSLPSKLERIPVEVAPGTPEWTEAWEALGALSEEFLRLHRWSILGADYIYRSFLGVSALLPPRYRNALRETLNHSLRLPTAKANAALRQFLLAAPDERETREFIARYGHRSTSLDYAAPTWGEWAEARRLPEAYGALMCPHGDATPLRRRNTGFLSRLVLYPVRRFLEMREEQRFEWERVLARQRALLLRVGQHLVKKGLLSDPEDLWFLTWPELMAAQHAQVAPDQRVLRMRQHAQRLYKRARRPAFAGPEAEAALAPASDRLQGIGASPGQARGRVALFTSPKDWSTPPGEPCIVVLPSLDPAWSSLLEVAAGVVLERGGLLSHAAVLAREYSVPLVTGVNDATRLLTPGMQVALDGATGEICILGELR